MRSLGPAPKARKRPPGDPGGSSGGRHPNQEDPSRALPTPEAPEIL